MNAAHPKHRTELPVPPRALQLISTPVEDLTNVNTLRNRVTPTLIAAALALIGSGFVAPATAQTMHIETSGRGQALIFPYYTVRNGTVSFVSLVNQTVSAKAVRVRVREAVGGQPVAELNVFLSAKDVWTAAIVPTTDGASIVSNDKSCTQPKFSGSTSSNPVPLAFSNAAYATDALSALDRTREGYLEVIEMATVDNPSLLGKDVSHVAGVPACRLTDDAGIALVQDPLAGVVNSIAAPSGGFVGTMSFINLADGLSVSYNATAINGFWKTGVDAPTPKITSSVSKLPDLASGGNGTITVTDKGKTYVSTFARSVDAVSALFMNSTISGEYAFTTDGVLSNVFVVTQPTKPYYVYSANPAPYQRLFSQSTGSACDDGNFTSLDREEFISSVPDDFGIPLPGYVRTLQWCGTANVIGFTSYGGSIAAAPTAFDSPQLSSLAVLQNQGLPAPLGKEGGHLQMAATAPSARLVPTSSFVLARSDATGELAWTPATHTYIGLPMIGFALFVAKYNAGSPQQNFGNLNPLSTQRDIR